MLPAFTQDAIQDDNDYIAALIATDRYQDTIAKAVKHLEHYYQYTANQSAQTVASKVLVPMETILDKFFLNDVQKLKTSVGKDALATVVSGDILSGLVNLGYAATSTVRFSANMDHYYSSISIEVQ